MLHDPLIADCAKSVRRFLAEQQHAADHKSRGTESDPDCRAYMHAMIIGNVADDCKHSRIGSRDIERPVLRIVRPQMRTRWVNCEVVRTSGDWRSLARPSRKQEL